MIASSGGYKPAKSPNENQIIGRNYVTLYFCESNNISKPVYNLKEKKIEQYVRFHIRGTTYSSCENSRAPVLHHLQKVSMSRRDSFILVNYDQSKVCINLPID